MAELTGAPYDLDPVTVTVAGSGTAPVDTTPYGESRWQFIARPWYGGTSLELTKAKSRKLNFRLEDPSDVGFNLDGASSQAAAIHEKVTDIHVLFTPDSGVVERLFRGRVGSTGDDLSETSHTVTVPALDYREVLNQRQLWSWNTLTYTGLDQAEIVWQLVEQTQGNVGGDLGISKGWIGTAPTGVIRDRVYEAKDSIGERIKELGEVINGFDWDIEPVSDSALALRVYYPQRGTNRGVVLEYGGKVATVKRDADVGAYENAIRYSGADGLDVAEIEAPDLATREEGRWDGAYGDTGLTTQQALDDRAEWQADESQVLQPSYTLGLKPGVWQGRSHIWPGDWVRVVIYKGRLAVDDVLRVFDLSIDIDDNGKEKVQLTVGGPKPDPAYQQVRTDRRLKNLENH